MPAATRPSSLLRLLGAPLLVGLALAGCQCGSNVGRARAVISVAPPALDFGQQAVGSHTTKEVTITNEGRVPLSVASLHIDGDARMAFHVDGTLESVDSGATATLKVVYDAPAAEGADGATLVIESDADNASQATVSLAGRSVLPCDPGKSACAGSCVDVQTDGKNCGTCGKACTADEKCAAGACVCVPKTCTGLGHTCGTFSDGCGGMLTCGGCGSNQTCTAGACTCNKTGPETDCTNGIDDDCDGLPDCQDTDCAAAPSCGTCPAGDVRVTTGTVNSGTPALVFNGTNFGVAWQQGVSTSATDTRQDFGFAVLSSTGALTAGPGLVTTTHTVAHAPKLVWNDTDWGLGWSDVRNMKNDLFWEHVSTAGAVVGSDVQVTHSPSISFAASLAWNGKDKQYGMAWMDGRDTPMDGSQGEIYFVRLDQSGAEVGSELRVTNAPGWADLTSVIWTGTEYGLGYVDYRDTNARIYFSRVSSAGQKVGSDVGLSPMGASGFYPSLAWNGSEYGVVFQTDKDGNNEIYFARVSAAGVVVDVTRLTNDAGSSEQPKITWNGSEYAVVWVDDRSGNKNVWFARLNAMGGKIGSDFRLTCASGKAQGPSIAWNGSKYGVAWADDHTGNYEIWFKLVP